VRAEPDGVERLRTGSGSTIMSYAGAAEENLEVWPEIYYHTASPRRSMHSRPSAAEAAAGPRSPRTIRRLSSIRAPVHDPARHTVHADGDGQRSDGDPDARLGGARPRNASPPWDDDGSRPLFRSYFRRQARRALSSIETLVGGTTVRGESLPLTARTLNFRATARDGARAEGVAMDRPRSGGGRERPVAVTALPRG
jgi:hypothetical protein